MRQIARLWLVGLGFAVAIVPTGLLLAELLSGADRFDLRLPAVLLLLVLAVPYVAVIGAVALLLVRTGRALADDGRSSVKNAQLVCGGLAALAIVAGVAGELNPEGQPPLAACLLAAALLLVPLGLLLWERGPLRPVALAVAVVSIGSVAAAATWSDDGTPAPAAERDLRGRPAPPLIDPPAPTWAASLQGEGRRLALAGMHDITGVSTVTIEVPREGALDRSPQHVLRFPDGTAWTTKVPLTLHPKGTVNLPGAVFNGRRGKVTLVGDSVFRGLEGSTVRGDFDDGRGGRRTELVLQGHVTLGLVDLQGAPASPPYSAEVVVGPRATIAPSASQPVGRVEVAVYGRATVVAAGKAHEGTVGAVAGRSMRADVRFDDGV